MCGCEFKQSLVGTQLPSRLPSSTFGYTFKLSLESSQLPSRLQSLMSGVNSSGAWRDPDPIIQQPAEFLQQLAEFDVWL